MKALLKKSFFFILWVANGVAFQMAEQEGDLRQLILAQHKETREQVKAEMESLFSILSESLNQRLTAVESGVQKSDNLFSEKLKALEFKVDTAFVNLSDLFAPKLDKNGTEVIDGLDGQTKSVPSDSQDVNQISAPKSESRVEVEDLSVEDSGRIEFDGRSNPNLKYKIWVFAATAKGFYGPAIFKMEENILGGNADVTLSDGDGVQHVWNSSQSDWREERNARGPLILLTLRIKSSAGAVHIPKFKLGFNATWGSIDYEFSREVVTQEGLQVVSFPNRNAQTNPEFSYFNAIIAPSSGTQFKLNLKRLNIPDILNNCDSNVYFKFLEEGLNGVYYKQVDSSAAKECGRDGNTSELIGTSNVAIMRFVTSYGGQFRVEVVPV